VTQTHLNTGRKTKSKAINNDAKDLLRLLSLQVDNDILNKIKIHKRP